MKKKIILTLFAIFIFFMPVQNALIPNKAEAFISKVMSLSAKKIAKEVAKDIAIESAANYAINEAFKIADQHQAKYNQQEAYKIVCLSAMTGEVCDKPVAVKEKLTEADKIAINSQAEMELEKLISPNGKGFTKWQKFMDWFGPVWITSAIMTVLTYSLDSEVRNLFNETGYNTLVALGLIRPVTEKGVEADTPPALETVQLPETTSNGSLTQTVTASGTPTNILSGFTVPSKNAIVKTAYHDNASSYYKFVRLTVNDKIASDFYGNMIQVYSASYNGIQKLDIAKNGTFVTTVYPTNSTATKTEFSFTTVPEIASEVNKMKSIMTRMPYTVDGFMYTDILFDTVDGNVFKFQMKHNGHYIGEEITKVKTESVYNIGMSRTVTTSLHLNQKTEKEILVPTFDESQQDLMENSQSIDKYDRISLIPPVGIPYMDSVTNEPLTVTPNPTPGGEPVFKRPDGTIVENPDDITVGDPNTTPSPNGSPQVTPQPTPSNPTPEPISLNPPNTAPPIETETPVFPEGESCSVGLKLPKISPLAYAVSEAFPFSIPFDLYDGFQAIFSEMGNEKPEFNYKLNFMGEQQEWKISIPDYFDSWKRFTDSFIIFIFDVGIIFMIFRFMGGSK